MRCLRLLHCSKAAALAGETFTGGNLSYAANVGREHLRNGPNNSGNRHLSMLDDDNRAHRLPQTLRYSMPATLSFLTTSENFLLIITIIIIIIKNYYNNNIIILQHLRKLVLTTCLLKHHLACAAPQITRFLFYCRAQILDKSFKCILPPPTACSSRFYTLCACRAPSLLHRTPF